MFKVFDLSKADEQKKAESHIKFTNRLVIGLIITVVLLLFSTYFFWSDRNKYVMLAEKQFKVLLQKANEQP
jgi:amino acid permease